MYALISLYSRKIYSMTIQPNSTHCNGTNVHTVDRFKYVQFAMAMVRM